MAQGGVISTLLNSKLFYPKIISVILVFKVIFSFLETIYIFKSVHKNHPSKGIPNNELYICKLKRRLLLQLGKGYRKCRKNTSIYFSFSKTTGTIYK